MNYQYTSLNDSFENRSVRSDRTSGTTNRKQQFATQIELTDHNYTKETKKNKKNKNPFSKVMKNGNLHAQKKEKLAKLENSRRNASQNQQAHLDQVIDEGKNPSEELLNSGHLPRDSNEYLDWMTKKVDTNELLEIVQVFQHK